MNLIRTVLIALLLAVSCNALAGENGYLGITIFADGDGFFLNPTLKSVTIEKVAINSPAAKAGIEPGDLVMEIEGKKIAGGKANDLMPYLKKDAGQTLHLAIRKSSGEVKQLAVVVASKTDEP